MGTPADAQFASQLGNFYQGLDELLDEFLDDNETNISPDQQKDLLAQQSKMIDLSNTFIALSDNIAFQNSATYYKGITDATTAVNTALKKISDTDKVVSIVAGCITLAEAIVSKNGGGVQTSVQSILSAVKS